MDYKILDIDEMRANYDPYQAHWKVVGAATMLRGLKYPEAQIAINLVVDKPTIALICTPHGAKDAGASLGNFELIIGSFRAKGDPYHLFDRIQREFAR